MSPVNPWRRQGASRALPFRTFGLLLAGLAILFAGIFFAFEDLIPTPFQ